MMDKGANVSPHDVSPENLSVISTNICREQKTKDMTMINQLSFLESGSNPTFFEYYSVATSSQINQTPSDYH